jgi:hypothetical protein
MGLGSSTIAVLVLLAVLVQWQPAQADGTQKRRPTLGHLKTNKRAHTKHMHTGICPRQQQILQASTIGNVLQLRLMRDDASDHGCTNLAHIS